MPAPLAFTRYPQGVASLALSLLPLGRWGPSRSRQTAADSHTSRVKAAVSLNVLGLDREFSATSSPNVLLPHVSSQIWGIAWSRDGTSVIYSSNMEAGTTSLWRVPVDGGKPPEHIAAAGDGASWPATTSSSDRFVFSRDLSGDVPYRFDPERPDRPLLTSSLIEGQLDFSPDDQRIAYCAESGEAMEVWVAGADGSSPQQLTNGPGQWQCSPHWSPDGRQIAFDSEGADYQWHIWTSAVDGGVPHQVTSDSGNVPTWSRDGQSIYYTERIRRYLADSCRGRSKAAYDV